MGWIAVGIPVFIGLTNVALILVRAPVAARLAASPEDVQRALDASEPTSRGDYSGSGSGDEDRLAHLTFLPMVISQ